MSQISPLAYIGPNVTIEDGCRIEAFASIGCPSEIRDWDSQLDKGVIIKRGTVISSHVTIDTGHKRPTYIGQNSKIFAHSHVGHDAQLEEGCILASASVGGFAYLMKFANLGMGSTVHQWQTIGAYSMIGMNSCVTKGVNVFPATTWVGTPAKMLSLNQWAIAKYGLSKDQITEYEVMFLQTKAGQKDAQRKFFGIS
jgi:UDP-N-acetylglucosamine acyltransferase